MSYKFKDEPFDNIFETGTTAIPGYKLNGVDIKFLEIFADLPTQTIGFFNTTSGQDIGKIACPIYTRYLVNGTHTCNSKATGVYLILVGGGGGGGSGASNSSFSGDGGGGGGGGGMFAAKISKSNNSAISTPITIDITIGQGGAGASRRTSRGVGYTGTDGDFTQAKITCTDGNHISAAATGGIGGSGGNDDNNGVEDVNGGNGGSASVTRTGGVSTTNGNSCDGNKGANGEDGSGPDGDISYGGNGGLNGYSVKSFFGIETSFTYGNGGIGGAGDTTASSYTQNSVSYTAFNDGSPGQSGKNGVVYVFEYFN